VVRARHAPARRVSAFGCKKMNTGKIWRATRQVAILV
jgi:hypothetical protein